VMAGHALAWGVHAGGASATVGRERTERRQAVVVS
jgi:hypothetical protein